jgi:hypothetical protein|tara:strand:+ start:243 stop:431 length:189 start_codon:yes stop_codon:yes gene_type:complete
MKSLDINIIQENLSAHECKGKCTGKNGGDGYCYHENGTKHEVGLCKKNHKKVTDENNRCKSN